MRVIWRNVKYPRIDLREGEIVVVAPRGTDIERLLESKKSWIERKLREIDEIKEKVKKLMEEGVKILDERYEIIFDCSDPGIDQAKKEIRICDEKSGHLKKQLKDMLRKDMEKRLEKYCKKLGVKPNRIYIREQHTKWGSCSTKKNVSFNLLLVFVPEKIRDFIAAHEAVHLIYPNHGREFQEKLREIYGEPVSRKDMLLWWYYSKEIKRLLGVSS